MIMRNSKSSTLKTAVFLPGLALATAYLLTGPARLSAADVKVATEVANPAKDTVGEDDVDIIIRGLPTKGRIVLPPSETEFKFKLKDTGTIMGFRWSDLEEYERKRVQKMYGMEVADGGRLVFGEKMTGVKYKLVSGKTLEGFREPDRDRNGMLALRTATAVMMINKNDVVSEEPFERYESDFYSAQEVYDRRMLEKPPSTTNAADHLAMARWSAGIGLYGKAIEHLEQAKIIDPRTEERNQDFRQELYVKNANQQAQNLFDMMLLEMRGGDYFSALDHLQQLDRSFKNSDLKSRWDALRPQIEAGSKTEINKKIVQMSYRIAQDLVYKKLVTRLRTDEKGNIVPSIPGKLVTTKKGMTFKGQLVGVGGNALEGNSAEADPYEVKEGIAKSGPAAAPAVAKTGSPDDVILKLNDTTITIAGKDVLSMIDIDLSVAAYQAYPNYDELKEYVAGADGLKAEMCRKISQVVKIPATDVQKIFDNRLAREARYEDGKLDFTNNYATFHDAEYGTASWFRPGAPKPMKYIVYQNNANPNGSSANRYGQNGTNNGGNGSNRNGNNNNRNQRNPNSQKEEESAEETDDPAIWWKSQTENTKFKFLKALMAEKVFKIDHDTKISCPTCGNKGMIGQTVAGGNEGAQRCPTCRGSGVLYKIIYH